MNFTELKEKIFNIKNKYSNRQNEIRNYYKELENTFYDYSYLNESDYYPFTYKRIFKDIVYGEDLEGIVMGAKDGELYLWKNGKNNKPNVSFIDYEFLTKLTNDTLKLYKKTKEEDLDIC